MLSVVDVRMLSLSKLPCQSVVRGRGIGAELAGEVSDELQLETSKLGFVSTCTRMAI